MELNFDVKQIPCIAKAQHREQLLEQSQEVKLGETMPDIGRVLCSWGQVLLRGKEWHGNTAGVSGGVMAWTMYEPEDGGEPCTVESWIPMNLRWETENPDNGGVIHCRPILKTVDARSTGARKLSVRAAVSMATEVMIYGNVNSYIPQDLPEDVQLLQHTYPVKLMKEAGEKSFDLDEILELPASCPPIDKIVYYCLQPEIADQKVMADKLVFRGTARVHLLYCSDQGMLICWDGEIPFSQYAELEKEFDADAEVSVNACTTSLELEMDENGELHLKAGIVGEYTVCECEKICAVEDCYSYKCKLTPKVETIKMPAILDGKLENRTADIHLQMESAEVLDASFWPEPTAVQRENETVMVHTGGRFQVLYRDLEGHYQTENTYWNDDWNLPASDECEILTRMNPVGSTWVGQNEIKMDVQIHALAEKSQGFPLISGITAGDPVEKKDFSLLICRKGEQSLWQLAKNSGSTVDAIRAINHLETEPEDSQFLLIPVI